MSQYWISLICGREIKPTGAVKNDCCTAESPSYVPNAAQTSDEHFQIKPSLRSAVKGLCFIRNITSCMNHFTF